MNDKNRGTQPPETDKAENPAIQQPTPGYAALAVDQELINDVMKVLRKAPWEEANGLMNRIQKCPQVHVPTAQ